METAEEAGSRIAVDLDGTLISTDLLWESALRYAGSSPSAVPHMVIWALKGKLRLKAELANRVPLDVATLPYKTRVIEILAHAKESGAEIVLATASHEHYARAVSDHLALFDSLIASGTDNGNVRGDRKAELLDRHFESETWQYFGDSAADIPVWRSAGHGVAVDPARRVARGMQELDGEFSVLKTPRVGTAELWFRQARIHQWIKNLLVFVPLVTAHLWGDLPSVLTVVLGFLAFGCTASATYLWNDLKDLDSDRAHATKRRRPLASGAIPIPAAIAASVLLVAVAVVLSLSVGLLFTFVLAGYMAVSLLYTTLLKKIPVADVVSLALLYTWRILAGCAAIGQVPSIWLLAFSVFMFFGLATMKRYVELVNHGGKAKGRGYRADDAELLRSLGVASSLISVLVFVLYIDAPQLSAFFTRPEALWIVVPLLLYWNARTWLIASRGAMHDDPVVFALKDRTSRLTFIAVLAIFLVAVI